MCMLYVLCIVCCIYYCILRSNVPNVRLTLTNCVVEYYYFSSYLSTMLCAIYAYTHIYCDTIDYTLIYYVCIYAHILYTILYTYTAYTHIYRDSCRPGGILSEDHFRVQRDQVQRKHRYVPYVHIIMYVCIYVYM